MPGYDGPSITLDKTQTDTHSPRTLTRCLSRDQKPATLRDFFRTAKYPYPKRIGAYFRDKYLLQIELVKLQNWIKETGHRVPVLMEAAMPRGGDRHTSDQPDAKPRCTVGVAHAVLLVGGRPLI